MLTPVAGSCARTILETHVQIDLCHTQYRRQSEYQSGQHTQCECENKHTRIEFDLTQVPHLLGTEFENGRKEPMRE